MNFGDRWDSHRSLLRNNKHTNTELQSDWNKYGGDNFEFAVIESVDNKYLLNDLEIKYVDAYTQQGLCYNINPGGTGIGKHLTESAKRKIGEKNRINMTGKKVSEETKKKMSESQRNRVWTDEQRKAASEKSRLCNTGRKRSQETKELLRKINQDNPPSAKLTPDDVRAIRQKKKDGAKLTELAEEYSTSATYISAIVHKRRWSHID